ncbi:MAG: glycerophosphodiester phosphodiesterase family protein [Phenylobacterium sp.]
MKRPVAIAALVLLLVSLGVYLTNASWLARPSGRASILAHRGVSQTFSEAGVDDATCTATRIDPPTHRLLENTIPSMRRAFELGAAVVELDIQPTTDGEFVVFHDWTLDCRTDGHGVTREHSLAQLRALDIGYGYTADAGRTHPFRGQGRGQMPTLAEALAAFPSQGFLINVKSNDPVEGERLAVYLATHDPDGLKRLVVIGGPRPVARLKAGLSRVRAFSPEQFKVCAKRYVALGWSGYIPEACRNILIFAPQRQAWLLWGWPNRFLARMHSVGSEVYVAGDLKLDGHQTILGLNDPARLRDLPQAWKGGVSTDRIDLIGPAFAPRPAH